MPMTDPQKTKVTLPLPPPPIRSKMSNFQISRPKQNLKNVPLDLVLNLD